MENVFFYDHLIFPLLIVEIFVGFRYESSVVFGLQKSPRPLRVRGDFLTNGSINSNLSYEDSILN